MIVPTPNWLANLYPGKPVELHGKMPRGFATAESYSIRRNIDSQTLRGHLSSMPETRIIRRYWRRSSSGGFVGVVRIYKIESLRAAARLLPKRPAPIVFDRLLACCESIAEYRVPPRPRPIKIGPGIAANGCRECFREFGPAYVGECSHRKGKV